MWRFRFGDPITSEVVGTVTATQAQVTAAGLDITLDEWGGCKEARWTGLTGAPDRQRVWIDVENPDAPEGWVTLFSGVLVRRPSAPSGQREAVGDKYLRLKEIPYTRAESGFPDGEDAGVLARALITDTAVQLRLPHLVATDTTAPDTGVLGKRKHRGESVAAALDGLISLKAGWGWTVLPSDALYLGPPPERIAVLNTAVATTIATFRDVTTEGLINAIEWHLTTPAGNVVQTGSQHASVATYGYAGVTRFVDQRSLPALGVTAAATFDAVADATEANPAPVNPQPPEWRDGKTVVPDGAPGAFRYRMHLTEAADWVEISAQAADPQGFFVTYAGPGVPQARVDRFAGGMQSVVLPALPAGSWVRVSAWNVPNANSVKIAEFNPRRLDLALLAEAAEDLYRIPPEVAATASELGIHAPAGEVTIKRPGLPDVTEKAKGTRYLIRDPMRTEYLVGTDEFSADQQLQRVLIDRKDREAVDQAVNTVNP